MILHSKRSTPSSRRSTRARPFLDEFFAKAGELGFLGVIFPEEYGGSGLGYVEYVLVDHRALQGGPFDRL